MVIVTIFSKPQLNAMLDKMKAEAAAQFNRPVRVPPGRSAWEIVDLRDVIVHVMTRETRDHYNLEGFYGACEEVELPFVAAERAATGVGTWQTRQ